MSTESFKIIELFGTKYKSILNNEGQPTAVRILRPNGEWDKMSLIEIQEYVGYAVTQARKDGLEMPKMGKPFIEFSETGRGFKVGKFTDRYKQKCSIQDSSLADEEAIWLGVNSTGPDIQGPTGKYDEDIGGRMHLTKPMAMELIHVLMEFTLSGSINS